MDDGGGNWALVQRIFAEALEHPPERRRSVVERRAHDPEVRREVLSLLTAHEEDGPLDALGEALSGEVAEAIRDDRESPFETPEWIGPYRILQPLGEGGMGIVYEAEQREPVHRRVALKMMKVGMDSREVVGRFEAERQALAMMDHPGIAEVLDAGVSEEGRPYFVMQLVSGMPIDEFCDRRRLSLHERVELFMDVCSAVQHAHQKGVIHRDLKPSNVLVSEDGGRPLSRVIDFGIAKATGQRLTDKTVVTTFGQALGTLTYMSPEQADTGHLDVDTRTDIYALGVMLYQLLLGVVPLDPKEVGAPVFLSRLVEPDSAPPVPTKRLTALSRSEQESVAARRRTDIRGLRRELNTDLRWILLKAIEKDRERRYQTASELADDLRRYLRDEAVEARAPTWPYRFSKFVRRNRWGVAAGGAVATAILLGLVGTSVGMVQARAAEARASQQTETADRALEFMTAMFGGTDPDQGGRPDVTAREVLDAGVARIDSLDGEPQVQARLLQSMGAVYTTLGLYDRADSLLRRAVDVNRSASIGPSGELERSVRQLAWLYFESGQYTRALPLARESVAMAEQVYGPDDYLYADALQVLGSVERDLANYEEARRLLQLSLEIREEALGDDHIYAGYSWYHLAWLHQLEGRYDEAADIYRRILPIFTAEFGDRDARTATVLADYAAALSQSRELADSAIALFETVLDIRSELYGPQHREVGDVLNNIGSVYADTGRPLLARVSFERALEIFEGARGTADWAGASHARALLNVAEVHGALGHDELAAGAFEASLAGWENTVGVRHPSYVYTLRSFAATLRNAGSPDAALPLEQRADSIEASLPEGLVVRRP